MEDDVTNVVKTGIQYGTEIIPREAVVYSKIWLDVWNHMTISAFTAFVADYPDVSFEYSSGGWIIRYNKTYRTLHAGDAIIVGYRNLIVMSKEEYQKSYREL